MTREQARDIINAFAKVMTLDEWRRMVDEYVRAMIAARPGATEKEEG